MAFHLSAKLVALGVVVAALITAFSVPESSLVPIAIQPTALLRPVPYEVVPKNLRTFGPIANPRFVVQATGYNSMIGQTDTTPHLTATGARTRFGIIAVSRDLLQNQLPYGSLVHIRDLGNFYTGRGAGVYQNLLDEQQLFLVEDTMHPRKQLQVDVWFGDYATAVNWGVRRVEIEVVRYGREGPELHVEEEGEFNAIPQGLGDR